MLERRSGIPWLFIALATLVAASGRAEAPGDLLAGAWSGDGFALVLEADGRGTLADSAWSPAEPMRWSATATTLTITQDGESTPYSYRLEAGRLRLSGGDLAAPVTMTRAGTAPAGGGPLAPTGTKRDSASGPSARETRAKPAAGDCAKSCRHYLACAGAVDDTLLPACAAQCQQGGFEVEFLGWFQTTDCATAILVVASLEEQARGLQTGQASRQGNSQCQGCVWDGAECNWYSQSNWGQGGAYSGAVISCDRACCGR